MKRILICFSYNGSAYSGYQSQKNAKSVQQTIEDALSKKLNQLIKLTASGRTDAGVHALCQYAHFDADIKFDAEKIVKIAKVVLPPDIVVYSAKQVANDFNARYDVKSKTYMYVFAKNQNAFSSIMKCFMMKKDSILIIPGSAELDNNNLPCIQKTGDFHIPGFSVIPSSPAAKRWRLCAHPPCHSRR